MFAEEEKENGGGEAKSQIYQTQNFAWPKQAGWEAHLSFLLSRQLRLFGWLHACRIDGEDTDLESRMKFEIGSQKECQVRLAREWKEFAE